MHAYSLIESDDNHGSNVMTFAIGVNILLGISRRVRRRGQGSREFQRLQKAPIIIWKALRRLKPRVKLSMSKPNCEKRGTVYISK